MNRKLISVIMSVYNNSKEVSHAIRSIENQNLENYEFLIMNDGSTDNTLQKLIEHKSQNKKIIIIDNKINIGLTKSLNKLISLTNGYYIARQDADDYSFPNRLNSQLKFIEENNLDGCTTRALIKHTLNVKPNLSYYLPNKIIMKLKNPFIHGSLLVKKNAINEIGNYNESFYYAQDYKLFRDLIDNNKKIKILKKPYYVLNTQNNISTKFKDQQNYYANCVKKGLNP